MEIFKIFLFLPASTVLLTLTANLQKNYTFMVINRRVL